MTELRLRRLFSGILGFSLFAPGTLLTGCNSLTSGSSQLPNETLPPDMMPVVSPLPVASMSAPERAPLCTPTTTISPNGINPSKAEDYIEVGYFQPDCPLVLGCLSAPTRFLRYIGTTAGTECQGATNMAACKDEVDRQLKLHCTTPTCNFYYIAVTQGDSVQVFTTRSEWLDFLGPIDTPQEALLIASLSGYTVNCNNPAYWDARSTTGGLELDVTRGNNCYGRTEKMLCRINMASDGTITEISCNLVTDPDSCYVGRRPVGLCRSQARNARSILGHFFAKVAHLEAASIAAFRILQRELAAHGAPAHLGVLAERARLEEIRHTALTSSLARRFGGQPIAPQVTPAPLRPIDAISEENAVEGCVRETFGALLASFQAQAAQDLAVKSAMLRIADDETRHAALSWEVNQWAQHKLGPKSRRQLQTAQRRAIAELRTEFAQDPEPALMHSAGLPSAAQAQHMIEQMEQELWARA